jgi:hypothetical protein
MSNEVGRVKSDLAVRTVLEWPQENERPMTATQSRLRLISAFALGFAILLLLFFAFVWPLDASCIHLLLTDDRADIPVPAGCAQNAEAVPDEMVKYLEHERQQRGLLFRAWITCQGESARSALNFGHTPEWLPSYVPKAYQFRRMVVILPYGDLVPQGSPVVGEICLMPRLKYVSMIRGQCNGKFAVWAHERPAAAASKGTQ